MFGGSTSGTDRAYYPSVLKVVSTYHIWYGNGAATLHAAGTEIAPFITKSENIYYLFYSSGDTNNNQAIGLVISTDGKRNE